MMADKKLSDLTAATSIAGTDLIYLQQGANSRKAQLSQVPNTTQMGWALYNDAATALEVNQVTVPANTRSLITIDGGAGSILTHVNGSGIQWTNNAHRNNNVGDSFSIRLQFRAQKSGSAGTAYLLVEQDIGSGPPQIIAAQEQALRADFADHPFTFNFLVYALQTYRDNGARFYLTSSVNVDVWQKSVLIRKDFASY